MYAVSPLRYPGAKWRLETFVAAILRDNNLSGGHYGEPYAGGASLGLSLLLQGHVREIHLNDWDRSVWAFWKCAVDHSEELIARVRKAHVTLDEWHAQQAVQASKSTASVLDLGYSTFFLNRTNRSGILTAGPIGGKSQSGKWRLDARFNKPELIRRLERISGLRSRIHVTRLDALTFIDRRSSTLPATKTLMYLDPPYFDKGRDLYMNAYEPEDHVRIARVVHQKLKLPWLISYDDQPQIRGLYQSATRLCYRLRYSASVTRSGREVVFMRPGLRARKALLVNA